MHRWTVKSALIVCHGFNFLLNLKCRQIYSEWKQLGPSVQSFGNHGKEKHWTCNSSDNAVAPLYISKISVSTELWLFIERENSVFFFASSWIQLTQIESISYLLSKMLRSRSSMSHFVWCLESSRWFSNNSNCCLYFWVIIIGVFRIIKTCTYEFQSESVMKIRTFLVIASCWLWRCIQKLDLI